MALALVTGLGLPGALRDAAGQTPFTGVFTFSGSSGTASPFAYNGTPILNLTVGDLTRANLPVSASAGNFRSTGFPLDAAVGTLTGTIDLSKYFEFTLTASAGYTFNLETLNFGAGRSGSGPRSFAWRSSADSYAASIPSYSSLGASGLFVNTSGTLAFLTDSTATTGTNVVLALSGSSSAYQGLSTIALRFYGFNSEASGGTGGLQGPLTFTGSLVSSGGSAYTWSGGAGTWENGQSGSFGQPYANSPSATATFTGTGGAVTVTGTVEAASVTIDSTGYSFQAGTISLANATVVVNTGSATIGSVLAGTNGLVKTGAGVLSLTGSNSYVGLTNIANGRLAIAADAALGDAGNDLSISGTLSTTATLTLGEGRSVSGAATLDIAPGTTLTSSGSFSTSAVTLANSGTLDLQGTTRSVGNLTFGSAAVVNAAGAISLANLSATGVTSGTATVNPALAFSGVNKTTEVGAGGTLVLNGDISGLTGRITKVDAGTLIASGSNSTSGFRLGIADTTPQDGGTLILTAAAASGTGQLQLNYGTLVATAPSTFANGLAIGGRNGARAVIGGTNAMTFSGSSAFYRGAGTSGELRLDVNNATSLDGGVGPTVGGGSATGITIGGTGSLAINGNALSLVDTITLTDAVDLLVGGTLGGPVRVGPGNVIGGAGTINGSLHLDSGAAFIFDPAKTLTVNGAAVTFGGFGIVDLIGFSPAVPNGSYTLIDGIATTSTTNLLNIGPANAYGLGGGRSAYFEIGSLTVRVVPEPSGAVLFSGGLLAAALVARRRRMQRPGSAS